MIDVFLRVHRKKPSDSWQRVLTYKDEQHLKQSVEYISKHPDVLKVEVIPIPDRKDKSYNDYIKEHFKNA